MAIVGDHNSKPSSSAGSLQAAGLSGSAEMDQHNLALELGNLALIVFRTAMTGKVAKNKESIGSCTYVNLKSRKKSTSRQLRVDKMSQMWIFLLVILFSTSQVAAQAKEESAEIGSCRFDMISLASLSCVEVGANWRPPSVACCNALVHAVDTTGSDGGACCLCRYISRKYSEFALATSYVICQGKDSHVVTRWTSIPRQCPQACRPRNDTSPADKDFPVENVPGTSSASFRILWIAVVAAGFSAILLVWFCYHWWRKTANPSELQPSNLRRRALPSETLGEIRSPRRHSSAQRRTSSSKSSPIG